MIKRSSFLQICAGAVSLLTIPFAGLANRHIKDLTKKGFKVDTGKDRFEKPITLFEGDTFYTKVSTSDTNGDLYIYESTRVKKGGPPLHLHYDQDEWWYVLEGEFLIKVGDQLYHAKPGDSVFGPRTVPHAFAKINEGNARLLMTFQPAGKMEAFFIASGEGKLAKMTPEEQDQFKKEHGFERVGKAINFEKAP